MECSSSEGRVSRIQTEPRRNRKTSRFFLCLVTNARIEPIFINEWAGFAG